MSFLASPAHNLALGWFSIHCSLRGVKLEPQNLLTVLERSPELTNAWGLWAFGIGWYLTEILSTPSKFSGCILDRSCVFTLFMLLKPLSTTAVDIGQIRTISARSRKLRQSSMRLLKMVAKISSVHLLLK